MISNTVLNLLRQSLGGIGLRLPQHPTLSNIIQELAKADPYQPLRAPIYRTGFFAHPDEYQNPKRHYAPGERIREHERDRYEFEQPQEPSGHTSAHYPIVPIPTDVRQTPATLKGPGPNDYATRWPQVLEKILLDRTDFRL